MRKAVKSPKVIKPKGVTNVDPIEKIVVKTIRPEKVQFNPYEEKIVVITKVPLPENHARCIVTKEHQGMQDFHRVGDIIDLPERRFKSDSFRGLVKQYEGDKQPNRRR